MFDYAKNIRPLLLELDDVVPLHEPVPIDVLIDLTRKHSGVNKILLSPTNKQSIAGTHITFEDRDQPMLIYFRPCGEHEVGNPTRACPECRDARFIIAKELSHAFDCDVEQTSAEDAEEMLVKERLKRGYSNRQAQADLMGTAWGAELLFRFMNRRELCGAAGLPASHRLTAARSTNDFSYFANQFCIPLDYAEWCFRENVLDAMLTIRTRVGLPI